MTHSATTESAIRECLDAICSRLEAMGASLVLLERDESEPAASDARVVDTVQPEINACIDRLEAGLTDDMSAATEEIGQHMAALGEECGAGVAELQGDLQDVADSTTDHVAAVVDSLAEMSETLSEGVDGLLQSIEEDLDSVDSRLAEAVSGLEQGLDTFSSAADQQWLGEMGGAIEHSTEKLLASIAEFSAGGDTAVSDIVGSIDDLLGQIEAILDVLEALRPAFDAVSLVA